MVRPLAFNSHTRKVIRKAPLAPGDVIFDLVKSPPPFSAGHYAVSAGFTTALSNAPLGSPTPSETTPAAAGESTQIRERENHRLTRMVSLSSGGPRTTKRRTEFKFALAVYDCAHTRLDGHHAMDTTVGAHTEHTQ
ncbi:hypothetical protein TRAPUB_4218 [Trametes pubescens]|uniref:Uncharacterized protein n=1 Tax=Trametes pubescens TaxID=154538 RepID=A0A1M2VBS2_TRAPU|nr:hypothetical protein TRAPUB_4218 [Trametes pubescens]